MALLGAIVFVILVDFIAYEFILWKERKGPK